MKNNTTMYKEFETDDINFIAFNDKVKTTTWLLTNEPDVKIDYENFHNKLFNIYNQSFLLKEKTYNIYKNKFKPWLTVSLLNFVTEKKNIKKIHANEILGSKT